MALVLDTNALSTFVNGDRDLHRVLRDESELAIPAIVLGEFLYGISQSRYRERYEEWLRTWLSIFLILEVGAKTAGVYSEIRVELKKAGRPIPTNDL